MAFSTTAPDPGKCAGEHQACDEGLVEQRHAASFVDRQLRRRGQATGAAIVPSPSSV
jgi:hypothetical protein